MECVKNAIKFTPENGTIRVRRSDLDGDRSEVRRCGDNGIGIPADVLPRFDAFEQGDLNVDAAIWRFGLALVIARRQDLHRARSAR